MKQKNREEKYSTRQCLKHKNYKGIRPTKRDCVDCQRLYKAVQRAVNREFDPLKPYKSLTTKEKRLGLIQFIAEISCVMLYGPQPPYFWNGYTKAAKHFRAEVKKLFAWFRREKHLFDAVHTIFYHTYSQHFKEQLAQREKSKVVSKGRVLKRFDEDDDEDLGRIAGLEDFGYDPEDVRRREMGKGYCGRKKEEDQG